MHALEQITRHVTDHRTRRTLKRSRARYIRREARRNLDTALQYNRYKGFAP